jgi:archaellum component FlaC
MLEYEDVFGNASDEYDKLKDQFNRLKSEYEILYRALVGDLEESIKIKRHLIERYQKDVNDLDMRKRSIIEAKRRAYNE